MSITGWVATHTGLPSLHVTGPATVRVGDRVLCSVADGEETLVSDALATPGVALTYTAGSQTVTLTRSTSPGLDLVTDATGRAIPMLRWQRGDAQRTWDSDVVSYPSGGSRRPEVTPLREGSGQFVLMDPALEDAAWAVLQSTAHLIITPGIPVLGLPPVVAVDVKSVTRSIVQKRDGMLNFDVSWTELPLSRVSGATPVVTWGEWQAYDHGWKSRTELELAHLIAGMPS